MRSADNGWQAAFFATLMNDQTHIGHLQNVVFDNVVTDIDNNYDPYLGIFVTPVAGVYMISTTLVSSYNQSTHYGFFVNNRRITVIHLNGLNNWDRWDNLDSSSQTVVLSLNKDDDVTVKHTDNDKDSMDKNTLFSKDFYCMPPTVNPVLLSSKTQLFNTLHFHCKEAMRSKTN